MKERHFHRESERKGLKRLSESKTLAVLDSKCPLVVSQSVRKESLRKRQEPDLRILEQEYGGH